MSVNKTGIASGSTHYQVGTVQPIDLIVSMNMDFLLGNVVKYACRAPYKHQTMSDLLKAKQYLEWAIEREQLKINGQNPEVSRIGSGDTR